MSSLVAAALGAAVALFHAAPSGSVPQTLYTRAGGSIAAFAQDGSQIVWFAPGVRSCNTVRVRSLENGLQAVLPQQGSSRNVTCTWDVGSGPVSLALAGGGVYRVLGSDPPRLVPGTDTTGAVAVAASTGAVAYVPAGAVGKQGRPLAAADLPVEIVDPATGGSIAQVLPQGTP